jgi:tetratricopeptide (TPR) repeat protein
VDPRERWQALQASLNIARASLEAGDRTRALAAVDAALAIDPEFLAAQSLRDRIIGSNALPPTVQPRPPVAPAPPQRRPLVSTEGYARFEERAKRRRVDKRIEAARSAIDHGKLRDAASALDEVIELDPNLPELASLTAAFDELRRSTVRPSRGPWVTAAAVFAATVLAASWLQESRVLQSRAVTAVAPLVAMQQPEAIAFDTAGDGVATTGTSDEATVDTRIDAPAPPPPSPEPEKRMPAQPARDLEPEPVPAPAPPTAPPPSQAALPASRPPAQLGSAASQPPPSVAPPPLQLQEVTAPVPVVNHPAPPSRSVAEAAPLPLVVPATPVATMNDDELQVKQVLQRYRVAYEGLDAQSAQAVWPAVNEVALARAFDGLESQRLTFDACSVELRGSHAVATCRGSARYVPKVGSRQPRIEPRTWSFALRKVGADWKIDNARADR